ncbi:MAG: RluA family pseudouridine synthase [Saccharofermentanales bacterium]
MKKFTVNEKIQGKRLVRAVCAEYPKASCTHIQKALKNKDIKINGKRTKSDDILCLGDEIEVYVSDDILDGKDQASAAKASKASDKGSLYSIVYQDENIIVINKRPGIAVHSGKGTEGLSLIELIRRDLNNNEINLCHRIDMNTGGLLLLARNKTALASAIRLLEGKYITKRYRCLVRGIPDPGEPVVCADGTQMKEIASYLEKASGKGDVYIHDEPKEGDIKITTRYRVLLIHKGAGPDDEDVSEIEVELVTGRMHQIRAHFAHIGHPLLGDGKYGRNAYNKFFQTKKRTGSDTCASGKLKYQQLYATSLRFDALPKGELLAYLSNRVFTITPAYDVLFL